jgi:preprotein translocase subunit SecE
VELRNSFNYFLVVLAFVDNTFIFITLFDYSFARGTEQKVQYTF